MSHRLNDVLLMTSSFTLFKFNNHVIDLFVVLTPHRREIRSRRRVFGFAGANGEEQRGRSGSGGGGSAGRRNRRGSADSDVRQWCSTPLVAFFGRRLRRPTAGIDIRLSATFQLPNTANSLHSAVPAISCPHHLTRRIPAGPAALYVGTPDGFNYREYFLPGNRTPWADPRRYGPAPGGHERACRTASGGRPGEGYCAFAEVGEPPAAEPGLRPMKHRLRASARAASSCPTISSARSLSRNRPPFSPGMRL